LMGLVCDAQILIFFFQLPQRLGSDFGRGKYQRLFRCRNQP